MTTADPTDRRQAADRRNASLRRRHAESRSLHIELCHSVLRVATVVDDKPDTPPSLTTRTVRWRHDASDLFCEKGRIELAAALRTVVNDQRMAGCRVSFAISSTLCVNRATSGATTKVEQELADLEDRSQLYLALGPGPKTTAVARKPIDARHEHAMVTVTNERTLELLIAAAESAGLVVDVVESSLVALSRLHGQLASDRDEPAILAQLDEDRFEVGVSRNGELLLEYRPASNATVADLGTIVDDHHPRFARFCQRQYGFGADRLRRLWLVGEPAEVASTRAQTTCTDAAEILPLSPIAEHFRFEGLDEATAEMGAALGLALRGRVEDQSVQPNLMEKIHATAKAPLRPFLLRAAAPMVATLLVAGGLWAFNVEQRVELAALQKKVAAVSPMELRGKRLASQLRDAGMEIQHLAHLAERTPDRDLDPLVGKIAHCLPADVWLKQMQLSDPDRVSIAGASYTEGGVYDFVRHLEEAPGLREVALRGTGVDQTAQGPATSFDIDFELVPAPPASLGPAGASTPGEQP